MSRHYKYIKIDTSNWTRENIAWAAGFIEGEGCFGISKLYNSIRITVCNTDLDSIEKLRFILGCGSISGPTTRGTWKPIYRYQVQAGSYVYAILMILFPFMSKRRKLKILELVAIFKKQFKVYPESPDHRKEYARKYYQLYNQRKRLGLSPIASTSTV